MFVSNSSGVLIAFSLSKELLLKSTQSFGLVGTSVGSGAGMLDLIRYSTQRSLLSFQIYSQTALILIQNGTA